MRRRPRTRTYDQCCGLARALDVIGDRWALLVVRELLFLGARRFTDLRAALPGAATNLLTTRLRALERDGVIRRVQLPPPGAATVYELTEVGRGLEPAVRALLDWGLGFLGAAPPPRRLRPELPVMAFRAAFRAEASTGVHDVYHLRVDDTVYELRVDDGRLDLRMGARREPVVVLESDLATFAAVAMRHTTAGDAIAGGGMRLTGEPAAVQRFAAIFARPRP